MLQISLAPVDIIDRATQIRTYLDAQGFNHRNLLYRIFSSDRIQQVLLYGTDRQDFLEPEEFLSYEDYAFGLGSADRKTGVDDELMKRGLTFSGGLWACTAFGLDYLLRGGRGAQTSRNCSLAVYDSAQLERLPEHNDFYIFKNQEDKQGALVAILEDIQCGFMIY